MKHLVRILLALLALAAVRADEPWPGIFDPFRVQTIYLQLDPADWNAVQHDTDFYDVTSDIRKPCQLWMSGDTAPNSLATSLTVQIRRKSDPALPSEANPVKVSLKIDVNEYVPSQSVRGLKKLSLENGGGGNGILKEGFAMNMHRMAADAGFHHWNFGNASWVRVVVNGSYVGLYSCPEQRDVSFLKNRGMYKQGASWLYEVNGSLTRDDSVNTTDSPTHTHLNFYPFRAPNAAPANFEQDVSEWVEMRSMLTMAAIEAFIANTDGLFTKSASNQGKNSFLADWLPSLKAQRTYLPWDLDGGFANTSWDIFAGGSGQQAQRRYQTLILQHYWFGEMYRHVFTELLDGPLSSAAMNAWLDQWVATVGPALAEDPNADQSQVASLRNYIAARIPNVRTQIGTIIQPPMFAPGAGEIAGGFSFSLTHANTTGASTLHYTTNGTDPRAYGGGVGASAVAYSGPVALAQGAHILARVRNVNGATTRWSNLREATFNVAGALAALKLTEIHYKPLAAAPFEDADEFEFLEFKNTGASALNLSNCALDGVDFIFPRGTVVAPGAFVVVVANPAAFEARYPAVPYLGVYWKNLSNSGEKLRLLNSDGSTIVSCEYANTPPWPLGPDATGRSLVNANLAGNPDDAANWRASRNVGGSPSADDPAPPFTPGVVFNEVLAKTSQPLEDAIELRNPTGAAIDVSGWWLSDDYNPVLDPALAQLKKFRIPAGTVIAAGGYAVFYEAHFNPAAPTADAPIPFSLTQDGESVFLASADSSGNLTGHIVGQKFGAAENNVAQGRIATSDGWDFAALTAHTFGVSAPVDRPQFRTGTGAANVAPRVGPVVFSEINYQPDAGGVEFIELMNTSAATIALDGWSIEGAAYVFPAGTSIAAGALLVVADTLDPAAFRAARGIPASVPVLAATFDLGDAGESLELLKPNADPLRPPIRIERVRYNDKAPWPTEAAGRGFALERNSAAQFGNDPLNWHTAAPAGSPGFFNAPTTSTVIARGTGWNYHALARDLGTAWRSAAYTDSAWSSGRAAIGFGTAVTTMLPYATNPKPLTTWLRKDFAIADAPAAIATLTATVNYNDGFIAYLNGTEVARRSLPASGVTTSTPATPHAHGTFETLDLTPFKNLLTQGVNVLAIELHLASTTDADAYCDADLAYTRTVTTSDTDADGIPDAWEIANALNPNNAADAAQDSDGDGFDNLREYLAGTDPHDPASRLRISSVSSIPGGWRIAFSTTTGRTYRVNWSPDLAQWFTFAENIAGTGGEVEVDELSAPAPSQRFYRVIARP